MATPFPRHSSSNQPKKLNSKVILLGDPGTGKSSLFYRIKYKQFRGGSRGTDTVTDGPTFPLSQVSRGFDSCVHNVIINPEQHVALTIMDSIRSQGRGQSLSAQYYKWIQAVILTCSVDNEHSLIRVKFWLDEARLYIRDPVFVLAVTKCDIEESKREISPETLENFSNHHNLEVFEVSAKTNSGVRAMLNRVAMKLLEHGQKTGRTTSEHKPLLGERSSNHGTVSDDVFYQTHDLDDCCCKCCTIS